MIQVAHKAGTGMTPVEARPQRVDIYTVAKRMFNEGFTKSTICRITGLSEDEFCGMIRELNRARPTLV